MSRLKRELTHIEKVQAGLGPADENSVTARLTFILDAINTLPPNTDIKVNDITVTQTTMKLTGDTNSRATTLRFFDIITKHEKLKKMNDSLNQKGGRDNFSVNLELKR